MAYSRYPRRGHRLAPATLRELLTAPIPKRYSSRAGREGMILADLDESAWTLFDQETCLALASEVVSAVGRAARAPLSIGNRPLPALPEGVTLADLELEVRTVNCLVSAGIHERPHDLNDMTIDGVLSLRGFWSKSLVDLLTAMEYVGDHPESCQERHGNQTMVIRQAHPAARFPRPNHRIAPSLLESLLDEPIPSQIAQSSRFPGTRLADLDETAWQHFAPEAIAQLAGMIISRVAAGVVNRDIQQIQTPALPAGLSLEDVNLENRTYNSLRRAGLARNVQQIGNMTLGDLMDIPAFGAKCLVDLLTALETLAGRRQQIDVELVEQAGRLAELPGALSIQFNDPRLGRLLRAMDSQSHTVAELVDRIKHRELDLTEPFRLAEGLGRLIDRIRRFHELPVEEELMDVFAPMANERDQQILAAYYNWDGQGGRTLEQLGRKYGLSRERIRQICMRCVKRLRHVSVFAPCLDRTLQFIADRVPRATGTLERQLQEAGLSGHGLSIAAIEEAAGFFSRTPAFHVVPVAEGSVAVLPSQAELAPRIAHAAKSAVGSFGAATVADVQAELAKERPRRRVCRQLLRETLTTLKDFQWLDARQTWFRLETLPQYGLPNMIEKVVSVAGRIDVSKLRGALGRYRRSGRDLPTPSVLLAYCRQMPSVSVEGDTICAGPSLDWRTLLADVERTMIEVLKEFGPVMDRCAFEEQCIRRGMNRFSFNAILMCTPVVTQYGRSIYGVVAQKTDPNDVRRARARARRSRTNHSQVLRSCGIDGEGRAHVAYCLSRAVISGGVITIPASLRNHVVGEYTVVSPGNKRLGRMMTKRGCGWGLGPALRAQGARPGDYLHLQFDNTRRTAVFQLGDAGLLDNHCPEEAAARGDSTAASSVTGLPS
ncbi:MAG: DNA-directed RNA polymerase subunit alpha C-terminal domain-containing protein [Thermoguttaceae bacterium]|nr:DNA-directed RNA polymerase subunit alpha C-terminal domain-containing protein [Thermoguttaceae bacterium]